MIYGGWRLNAHFQRNERVRDKESKTTWSTTINNMMRDALCPFVCALTRFSQHPKIVLADCRAEKKNTMVQCMNVCISLVKYSNHAIFFRRTHELDCCFHCSFCRVRPFFSLSPFFVVAIAFSSELLPLFGPFFSPMVSHFMMKNCVGCAGAAFHL